MEVTSDPPVQDVFSGHGDKIYTARFMAQGTRAVSGSHDKMLKVWDLHAKQCVRTLFVGSTVHDVCTSDQSPSNSLISGHYDGRLRVWDMRGNEPVKDILLSGRITSLQFHHGYRTRHILFDEIIFRWLSCAGVHEKRCVALGRFTDKQN